MWVQDPSLHVPSGAVNAEPSFSQAQGNGGNQVLLLGSCSSFRVRKRTVKRQDFLGLLFLINHILYCPVTWKRRTREALPFLSRDWKHLGEGHGSGSAGRMGLRGERGEEPCVLGFVLGGSRFLSQVSDFQLLGEGWLHSPDPCNKLGPHSLVLMHSMVEMLTNAALLGEFLSLCYAYVWVISPLLPMTCTLFSWGADLPQTSQREATHWGSHLSCRLAGRLVWRLNKRSPEAPGSYHRPSAVCREHPVSELLLHRSWNTGEAEKVNTGHDLTTTLFLVELRIRVLSFDFSFFRWTRSLAKGFCFLSLQHIL